MRIGVYQFTVVNNLCENMIHINSAITEAARNGVELLFLPECALTGYPKESNTIKEIDFQELKRAIINLEKFATESDLFIVAGTAEYSEGKYYNSAVLVIPGRKTEAIYRKRALWGWDADNFSLGEIDDGVIELNGFRIGVRICFEVRFPEYFRELYRKNVDCAVVLFSDTLEEDSLERYDLIKSHLKTRAIENVIPVLSVNSAAKNQTAPTAAIDQNGAVVSELPRHEEALLIFELEKATQNSFGAKGRKYISDLLTK